VKLSTAYDAPKKEDKIHLEKEEIEKDIFSGRKPDGGFCIKCGSQMYKFGHCEERCSKPDCLHVNYNGCGQ